MANIFYSIGTTRVVNKFVEPNLEVVYMMYRNICLDKLKEAIN